jgi:hypothetical protein
MQVPRLAAIVLTVLMVVPAGFVTWTADANPPPFGIGDWIVTGPEIVSDQSIVLDGNLLIYSGGVLTLSNTTLLVTCSSGAHQITVYSGGTLNILDRSVVGSMDPLVRFGFTVMTGAIIRFEDSMFDAAGNLGQYRWMSGGIGISTASATIKNCTFTGNVHDPNGVSWGCAMTVSGAGITLTDCTFTGNDWGLVSFSPNLKLENCTFSNNWDGVIGYFGGMEVDNCTFSHNTHGVVVDGTTLTVRQCEFFENSWSALRCQPESGLGASGGTAHVKVEDCFFERNTVGIDAQWSYESDWISVKMYHVLELVNSVFRDHKKLAIDWPQRERTDDYPNQTSLSIWRANADCGAYNDTIIFNGKVRVESGGNLTLSRTKFKFDGSVDGDTSVEVKKGGALRLVSNSTIRTNFGMFMYTLAARAGSTFEMDGSSLRDCGYELDPLEHAGPFMETGNIRVSDSSIDFCPYGMILCNETGALIDGSTVRGLTTGFFMLASELLFRNSTLTGVGGFTANLVGPSLLDALNSQLVRDRLIISDTDGMVNISWYLDAKVTWANGSAAPGANISIKDLEGNVSVNSSVGKDGWLRNNILKEVSISLDDTRRFTPHNVSCSLSNITASTLVEMNSSLSQTFRLIDGKLPAIRIFQPAEGSWVRTGSVLVNGTATDNIRVGSVELVADGFRRHLVYYSEEQGGAEVDWNITLELSEGPHTIEAIVLDGSGNLVSELVNFQIDTIAPKLFFTEPPDEFLTNSSLITVSGVVEPGARVLVQDSEVIVLGERFSGTVLLSEGDNIILAKATDRAGNENTSALRIWLDTLPPALNIFSPSDGMSLNVPMVEVNGTMEEEALVFVNGRWVAPVEGPGRFRTTISIVSGSNSILIDAVDAAGNHNRSLRKVFLDTQAPFLEVRTPRDGILTNQSSVVVSGSAEGGCIVYIGTVQMTMPGEPGTRSNYSTVLKLAEGDNLIIVRARDAAGNENRIARHVTLDTIAPSLTLTSPADNSKCPNATVYVSGRAEAGARVTINGEDIIAGLEGLFAVEERLVTGRNSFTVRATDEAGNFRELTVSVRKDATPINNGPGASTLGPDWGFIAFLACAATFVAADGYILMRHFRKIQDRKLPHKGER